MIRSDPRSDTPEGMHKTVRAFCDLAYFSGYNRGYEDRELDVSDYAPERCTDLPTACLNGADNE